MRTFALIIVFLFSLFSRAQNSISTQQIDSVANVFGVDSALRMIPTLTDLTTIDTSVALSIALKCQQPESYFLQLWFLSRVGQSIKSKSLNDKVIKHLKVYRNDRYNFVIPEEIVHVIVFQKDSSVVSSLNQEFDYWEHKADSAKRQYASGLKRFFQRFRGLPPSEKVYYDCKENSFKIAWALNKFHVSEFSDDRVKAIREQLQPFLRDFNMEPDRVERTELKSDTIFLQGSYSEINEIDFESEPELKKLSEDLEGEKCGQGMIINVRLALYSIGCRWGPFAGRGRTYRLELIDRHRLKVRVVTMWIS